ncbi:aminoacyl-tRNA hydrolase [Thermincola ferriacetica]
MKLIVGLGNPGKEYEFTRHNIGFLVLEQLAEKWGIAVNKNRFKSLFGEGVFQEDKIVLLKPQTFMNLSGQAVLDAVRFYKLESTDILVIYDDMDLPTGRLRLRKSGGAGGHRGMESIIYLLNTENFPRLRIGIGKPGPDKDAVQHVLGRFGEEEREKVVAAVSKAVAAVELVLKEGVEKAMNTVNRN